MRLTKFHRHAERFWVQIPERFREGATLLVHDEAEPDPDYPGVYLLGACEPAFEALDQGYDLGGGVPPLDRRSLVHLWYGSFRALADASAGASPELSTHFAWADEIEETLLHELTHHWEERAGLDGLDRFDAAQLQNFRRLQGHTFEPGFWRDGEARGPFVWAIDGDLFVEVEGPPPFKWDPGDGQGLVVAWPDPETGVATIFERGELLNGARLDLVLCPRPKKSAPLWRRLWTLVSTKTGGK
ncbi:MAG: hypothetical protein EXR76_11630 [Myxococcales bacterium]|nr:hypothetical protein [Myxococcales bacterium]